MARLLIAGYGFLGRALESRFAAAGWTVDKLNRSGADDAIACDLSVTADVAALTGDYDLIIHCAASGGGGEQSYHRVYFEGANNLLQRFAKTPFIFTSSTSVYPQADHSWVTEQSEADPLTPTAMVLREAEKRVLASGGVVARLSGLYGPGRCHVLKNLLAGTARLDGRGERIMNFIHRDDVASAMLLLASLPSFPCGEIYNVTAEPVSQYDCYAALAEHFDLAMPEQADENKPRKRGNSSKRVSNEKLRGLGWEPQYDDFLSLALACRQTTGI
jgi:nucleoside-diphosphate-sugar epimerase